VELYKVRGRYIASMGKGKGNGKGGCYIGRGLGGGRMWVVRRIKLGGEKN